MRCTPADPCGIHAPAGNLLRAIVVAPFRLVIWCWRRDLSSIVRQGYAMTIRQVEDGALADGVNAALPTECCRG
jgi:hypothetical protein